MIRSIFVPQDGSAFAECALTIARRGTAEIRLVAAVTPLADAADVKGLYFSTRSPRRCGRAG